MNAEVNKLLPAKIRAALYIFVGVIFAGVGAWQASEGNWVEFSLAFLPVIMAALAVPNTNTTTLIPGPAGPTGEPGATGEALTIDDTEVQAFIRAAVAKEVSAVYQLGLGE